jgi:transglutaminase-like putative cysteine protease
MLRYRAGQPFHPETEFVYASPNVALHDSLRDYALRSFAPGVTVAAGAIDLMHRIHADFDYHSESPRCIRRRWKRSRCAAASARTSRR